jgi:hypothetical protein
MYSYKRSVVNNPCILTTNEYLLYERDKQKIQLSTRKNLLNRVIDNCIYYIFIISFSLITTDILFRIFIYFQ